MDNQLKKQFKRTNILVGLSLGLALTTLTGEFIYLSANQNTTSQESQVKKPTIALVNEDQIGNFNNQSYNFGKSFVDLVSHDSRYNWQVVSRSVADRAYSDGAVDAVIYLPQNLTHDLLTLQDLNPTQAEVGYKLLNASDALSSKLLQEKIASLLSDFNRSVVKMYYVSVAGNVAEAQTNMTNTVGNHSDLLDMVSQTIAPDFKNTHQGYSSVISVAGSLKGQNTAWIAAQNSFTESTKKGLEATSQSLSAQMNPLSQFFESQKQMMATNIYNGNQSITSQGVSDKTFYDTSFDTYLNQLHAGATGWTGFNGLSSTNEEGSATGDLVTLNNTEKNYQALADNYNQLVEETKQKLQANLSTLDGSPRVQGSLQDLQALEQKLILEYFNLTVGNPKDNNQLGLPPTDLSINSSNYNIDGAKFTASLAKRGLADKISHSFGDNSILAPTLAEYQNKILALVRQIPTDNHAYVELFDALKQQTTLTDAQRTQYEQEIALIQRYDEVLNTDGDPTNDVTPPTLNLVYPQELTNQKITKTLQIKIPKGTNATITGKVDNTLIQADTATLLPTPDPNDSSLGLTDDGQGTIHVTNTGATAVDETVTLNYTIDCGNKTNLSTEFKAVDDQSQGNIFIDNEVYVLMPSDAMKNFLGSDAFMPIANTFSLLDSASQLLLFLDGQPGQNLSNYLSLASNPTYSFYAEPTSVYRSYGAINNHLVLNYLQDTDQDVMNYQKIGQTNLASVIKQITAVQVAIERTKESLATLNSITVPRDYFTSNIHALNQWYDSAMNMINGSQEIWNGQNNSINQLQELPWQKQEQGKQELYSDQEGSQRLYESISHLVENSSKTATETAKSAQAIKDNSASFEMLSKNVITTKEAAQKTLDQTNGTIHSGIQSLQKSKDYNSNFETVLANTRSGDANSTGIFDFLSQPLQTKNQTPKSTTAVAKPFDFRWPLMLGMGVVFGMSFVFIFSKIKTIKK